MTRRPEDLDYQLTDPPEFILESDLVRKQHFRRGTRGGIYQYSVKGVPREYWDWMRKYARRQGQSFNVWLCTIAEACRDNRLLVLPPGYSLDTLISERMRELIHEEAEKTTLRILGDHTEADPYRR